MVYNLIIRIGSFGKYKIWINDLIKCLPERHSLHYYHSLHMHMMKGCEVLK